MIVTPEANSGSSGLPTPDQNRTLSTAPIIRPPISRELRQFFGRQLGKDRIHHGPVAGHEPLRQVPHRLVVLNPGGHVERPGWQAAEQAFAAGTHGRDDRRPIARPESSAAGS